MSEPYELSRPAVPGAQLARVLALVETTAGRFDWRQNSYVQGLETISREDFVETQVQFFWAVTFFSRPMSLLVGKIPRTGQRVEVLRNVWEEHGEGNTRGAHSATFREFLSRLDGLDDEGIEARVLWPELRAFNTTLVGACLLDEWIVGAATLGMIEHMFQGISGAIGRGILARGWLRPEQLVHYDVHEQLDVRHSTDFFRAVASGIGKSTDDYYVEQGLMQGAAAFLGLYDGLYRARARRWTRPHRLPHVRV
ncbi:MAG: iron-containing redox enzyme family protein [Deltaproteobacteria bacterium]|nr:iron-containing redox enzyme family protein [Deltaproteobacteria bacterium]